MAQITRVTSEALQATIRRLLPSQVGFGEDLQATNVITPIIDLTPAAEGSEVRADLQTALAHGSQTAFSTADTQDTLANSPGFWRVVGTATGCTSSSSGIGVTFTISDGSTEKSIWRLNVPITSSNTPAVAVPFDFVVFLRAGDSLTVIANARGAAGGSYRQIATVTGELVNPSGFVIQ